ncbi:MAG: hypothetical protein WC378_11865 [Opitutaceae bacterium]|jgi:hypothetical protein
MSNWITPTQADVLTVMAGAELDAVRSQALADGQTDPLPGAISEIVQLVRGFVAASATLSSGETIPRKLLGASLNLIRDRLLSRLPIQDLSNPDRTAQTKAAYDLLKMVRQGDLQVDTADDPITTETASPAPVELASSSRSHFSRNSLNGL